MHRARLETATNEVDQTTASTTVASPVEVLLVTPDTDLRAAGERALTGAGYRVRVAAHSGHAVLASMMSRIDVLVTELSTPDISGPALAELLRRHHPQLRVVFMANPGTPEGLEHVVVRPFTRDDLIARISVTSSQAS